jgi:hypothetical protein
VHQNSINIICFKEAKKKSHKEKTKIFFLKLSIGNKIRSNNKIEEGRKKITNKQTIWEAKWEA